MEHSACNVVYLDKRAQIDRVEKSQGPVDSKNDDRFKPLANEPQEFSENLNALLSVFNQGMLLLLLMNSPRCPVTLLWSADLERPKSIFAVVASRA